MKIRVFMLALLGTALLQPLAIAQDESTSLEEGDPAAAVDDAEEAVLDVDDAATEEDVPGEGELEAEASASPLSKSVEDTDYAVRLRGLEEQVNELKERIFRSKARLLLLRETVLNGVISGARARIVHRNEMGSAFRLEQATYALDGSPLLNKGPDDEALRQKRDLELFNGSIVPGNHNISVYLLFRGNGYGVFSYLRGYTFKIQSSYAFTAEEGKLTTIKVVAYEKGGFTTDLQDRVAIRYDVESKQDVRAAASGDAEPES